MLEIQLANWSWQMGGANWWRKWALLSRELARSGDIGSSEIARS